MKQVLVAANQTLGGEQFRQAVADRAARGDVSFVVLVPATEPRGVFDTAVSAYAGSLPTSQEAADDARQRLEGVLAALRSEGVRAEGVIGDADPVVAVEQAMDQHRYDEIILSTLPPGASRWLGLDVLHRVERSCGVPVTHVAGSPGPRSEAPPPA